MIWPIQASDLMKVTQDNVGSPLSLVNKQKAVAQLKALGVTHVPISTPYDTPSGYPDVVLQLAEWAQVVRAAGLKIWHRHSWLSDQGWYGVPKNTSNDRINDTVAWIKTNFVAHPQIFEMGDIFTPKPEPQNMGVVGVNGDGDRFKSAADFNEWLRAMSGATKQAFSSLGLGAVKVGYWGFDGYIVCGFGNPDWQGKSFLEASTVAEMDNTIAADHYPPTGTTMADFLRVFKQTWPGKKLVIGEYGAKGTDQTSNIAQIKETFNSLVNDPVVVGVNYWPAVGGIDGPILDNSFQPVLGYDTVKSYFMGTGPVPPDPIPTPTTKSNAVFIHKTGTAEYAFVLPALSIDALKDKALNFGRQDIINPDGTINFGAAKEGNY